MVYAYIWPYDDTLSLQGTKTLMVPDIFCGMTDIAVHLKALAPQLISVYAFIIQNYGAPSGCL